MKHLRVFLAIMLSFSLACSDPVGADISFYEEGISSYVNGERIELSDNNTIMAILIASSCSCQESSIEMIKTVFQKSNINSKLLLIKDDTDSVVTKKFHDLEEKINIIHDDSKILEKYGNTIVSDKIIVFNKKEIVQIFDVNKNTFADINSYFKL